MKKILNVILVMALFVTSGLGVFASEDTIVNLHVSFNDSITEDVICKDNYSGLEYNTRVKAFNKKSVKILRFYLDVAKDPSSIKKFEPFVKVTFYDENEKILFKSQQRFQETTNGYDILNTYYNIKDDSPIFNMVDSVVIEIEDTDIHVYYD